MSESKKQQILRKANPDIGFRITSGEMSFVGRKIYNSLIYRAQQKGMEGKGKLPFPVRYDLAAHVPLEKYWWVSLSEIIDDAATGTRNHTRVKNYLRSLMSIVVERDAVGWEIDHIISKARIVGTSDPNGNGGRGEKLMVGWYFPVELEHKLISPNEYTRLSLYYQSLLRTEQSLVLYEICKRYSTSPAKLTSKLGWQIWQEKLIGSKSKDTYKEFNRHFLAPAIKAVNEITDIELTLIEHRAKTRGRQIECLQFVVETKEQAFFKELKSPAVPADLLNRMETIGISPAAAEKILTVSGEEKIKAALAVTEKRLTSASLPALLSPAAYFKKALNDDYAGSIIAMEKTNKAAAAKAKESTERKKTESTAAVTKQAHENAKIMELFYKLEYSVQDELWAKYTRSTAKTIIQSIAKKENDGHPMDRDSLLKIAKVQAGFAMLVKSFLE